MLNILFLPVRGIYNVITFNIDQNWEKEISVFKLCGYIDICIHEDTQVLFELKHGKFDKESNSFMLPMISFFGNVLIEQSITSDVAEISKGHCNHLLNIASVSLLLFTLLVTLANQQSKKHY